MIDVNKLKSDVELIRKTSPLVHNIINGVAMNFAANALLAIGASPIMSYAKEEMEDMVKIANVLTINIGTLDEESVKGMLIAGKTMHKLNKPIIFDPVGVGATPYRNQVCKQIIEECNPTIIRGNASEIMAILNTQVKSKGVDSTESSDTALDSAKQLAKLTKAVVVISGETDYITDGDRVEKITNGSTKMTSVTAMGCTATTIIGAFAAINPNTLEAALHAMAVMGLCGEDAANNSKGNGSLMINFLDNLSIFPTPQLINQIQ